MRQHANASTLVKSSEFLNVNRASKRRKPEDISSISQPFDTSRFNFNKISEQEIMIDVETGDGNNVIAINVSPIEWGHCLLLTDRFQNLPQKMTKSSLKKALELLIMSNSVDLRVAFNSLGAYASVNHLHWHLYYLRHRLLLESIILEGFKGPVDLLVNFPAKGFCISLSSIINKNTDDLVSCVFLIVNFLQNNDIAHSVYITRAKSKPSVKLFDDVRVYIWARKSVLGVKDTSAFIPAVCELFGHLSIKTQEDYTTLTEHQVATILDDVTAETFYSIKENIAGVIEERQLLLNITDIQSGETVMCL
ncbi:GDP-D-glucose phosphorylase 1 isoform X2 [Belonocnema kinseyi]|uniref:GDP-D-glucose phosphorylase 1 isoform X2 n=1 Tax=Belonocnema kinseyi TaxID=2817044 RepID=UPI00143DB314|nr:GDP-D-glucose phosphorylase 1 isoform X2 [Belonocnema kinseyi]